MNEPAARFRVQQVDTVRHYNKNTFEWLFTDQVPYSRWLCDDGENFGAIFWITGKPGSGKSTLMRFALEDSRTMSLQPSNSNGHSLAYFFHLRGKSLVQKSLRGMLMELLYQLLEKYPRSFEIIRPTFMSLKRGKQDWNIQSLSKAFISIPYVPPAVPGCKDHITLFIDALDEDQNQADNNTLLEILDDLLDTYRCVRNDPDTPVLKICLASRPWPIFQQRLGEDPQVPSFAIHDFTANDIQEYTNARILTTSHIFKEYGKRQKAISQLSADIALRANGVFLWVKVVVDNLRQDIIDGTAIESLEKTLHKYPEELDDMYKFTLKRIREAYRPETMIIFKTMLASRTSLTAVQLYTVTNICMRSEQYDHDAMIYFDSMIRWLASRSGGLIDVVDTGAEEQRSVASGSYTGSAVQLSSNHSVEGSFPAEFIHQTVEDFVRNSLDDVLEIAKTESAVAQLSGSRLLALACLDKHPPHHELRNLAKDIFSYIREVEREEDEKQSQQLTYLSHWDSFDLHDFPFKIRQPQIQSTNLTTPEMLEYYMDTTNALAQKIVLPSTSSGHLYDCEIPHNMAPFVVTIMHDLYRTKGPEHFLTLSPKLASSIRHILLFIASVGPRLSNDRLDRLRMFQHILSSYTTSLSDETLAEKTLEKFGWQLELPYSPINQMIDNISTKRVPRSLAAILASLKPSTELDDDSLLAFAQSLNGEGYEDFIEMEFPGGRREEGPGGRIRLPLSAFCSRFRNVNRFKWVDLFSQSMNNSPIDPRKLPLIDLAEWDALNRQPPPQVYTEFASNRGVTREAIAWASMLAPVVGMGGSRLFQAFYPKQRGVYIGPRPHLHLPGTNP